MEMKMRGAKALFNNLRQQLDNQLEQNHRAKAEALRKDLADATPVDTGLARDSWKSLKTGEKIVISNPVPYLEFLNNGTSQQAPANFIETTALKHGTPRGAITEFK